MSERSTGEQSGIELPPGWTAADTTTPGGHLYVTVWRAFPDATPFEFGCAMASPPDPGWIHDSDAVTRVRALREAQGGRSDLPEDVWQRCIRLVYPTLSEQERQNPKEILKAIAAFRPPRDDDAAAHAEARSRDVSRGGLTREQIVDAAIANREPDGTWPKQAAVAEALRLADARQIRNVQGQRGWLGIIADAQARLARDAGGS